MKPNRTNTALVSLGALAMAISAGLNPNANIIY